MPKPALPKYRTMNWSAYNAALKQRGSLDVWFDLDMEWLSAPAAVLVASFVFGQRDRTVPDAESAVQFATAAGDGVGGEPAQAG